MIKFHYHTARGSVRRLDIEPGDRLCHVYSDESLEELHAWMRRRGLRPAWVHHRGSLPHFDAHGSYLALCGPGVDRSELKEDLRRWRRRPGRPRQGQ